MVGKEEGLSTICSSYLDPLRHIFWRSFRKGKLANSADPFPSRYVFIGKLFES
jgi:hypothetical protein